MTAHEAITARNSRISGTKTWDLFFSAQNSSNSSIDATVGVIFIRAAEAAFPFAPFLIIIATCERGHTHTSATSSVAAVCSIQRATACTALLGTLLYVDSSASI